MTIKADYAEPCWEPIDLATGQGYWHDEDLWPHYKTRAEAAEAIAGIIGDADPEDYPDGSPRLVARLCFDGPCVVIVCDGCGEEFDYEGDGGMHFDPADPMPVPISECDWTIQERVGQADRHYCPECAPSDCDECGQRHDDEDGCPDALRQQSIPVSDGQLTLGGAL